MGWRWGDGAGKCGKRFFRDGVTVQENVEKDSLYCIKIVL